MKCFNECLTCNRIDMNEEGHDTFKICTFTCVNGSFMSIPLSGDVEQIRKKLTDFFKKKGEFGNEQRKSPVDLGSDIVPLEQYL